MRTKLVLLLVVLCTAGLGSWYLQPHRPAETTLPDIQAGMTLDEVDTVMKPVALEAGTVYFGGSGSFQRFYALPGQLQFSVICVREASGTLRVVELGKVEPKRPWVRHSGDSIGVER